MIFNDFLKNFSTPVTSRLTNTENDNSAMAFEVFPHIQGITEAIQKIFDSFNVKSPKKLLRHLAIGLQNLTIALRRNREKMLFIPLRVMTACNQLYIGQTKIQLNMRIKERQRALFFSKESPLSEASHKDNKTIALEMLKLSPLIKAPLEAIWK